MSLNNHRNQLAEPGQREEALAAIEEAVTIYRQLAARPARRVPARPRHVAEQPVRPPGRPGAAGGGPGRDRGSRHLHRQLAAGPPRRVPARPRHVAEQPRVRLADLGQREQALAAIEEAVTIRRQLAHARPDAFLPDLATSLNNRRSHLANAGTAGGGPGRDRGAADHLPPARPRPPRRVPARPRHVAEQPSRPPGRAGRREQALAATEAVTLRRQLAHARPAAFLPDLALSLNNQSSRLSELGRREEALAAIEEAVTIRRQLAEARPQVYSARLAASLQQLAALLEAAGRKAEADTAMAEAARLE